MELVISSAHGLRVRGASGLIDEVNESRKVVDRVAKLLRMANVGVKIFHDNTSTSVSANLTAIVNFHNAQKRDRDVSIHFNAFARTDAPRGTECLYATQLGLAGQVARAMASAGGFINRGAKKRSDLAFLNRTKQPAVLLEVCFVDSSADVALYHRYFEGICRGIAESISGVRMPISPELISPPEPVPLPTEPQLPTGANIVDIIIKTKGHVDVKINDDPINDGAGEQIVASPNRLALTLVHDGDVVVTVNGEDFHIELPTTPPPTQPRPTLRRGSRGPDVRIVQNALNALPIDGIFGIKTETAVRKFQEEQALTIDGIVGPRSWEALERMCGWAFTHSEGTDEGSIEDD